jgi:hypothetical protein
MLRSPVPSPCVFRDRTWVLGLVVYCLAAGCGLKNRGLVVAEADASPPVAMAGDAALQMMADAAPIGAPPVVLPDAAPAPKDLAPAGDAAVPLDGALARDAAAPPPSPLPPDARPPDLAPPADTAPPPKALLLVAGVGAGDADRLLTQRLQGLGFVVVTRAVRGGNDAMEAAAAAAGMQLVVMSSSMLQGPGMPRLARDLPVPLLDLKVEFIDNLGLGAPSFRFNSDQTIDIVTPGHPAAAGRSGAFSVTSNSNRMSAANPIRSATIIASTSGDREDAAIFAVERGDLTDAGPAPARRVAWLADEPTIVSLNAAGWALFDAAVRWATGR